jgi:hypothetical protein
MLIGNDLLGAWDGRRLTWMARRSAGVRSSRLSVSAVISACQQICE